jgi:hypothetical protein
VVSVLASGSRVRGFFLCVKNPQHAFLRRGSQIICPMFQLWAAVNYGLLSKIDSVPSFANRGSRTPRCEAPLEMKEETLYS